MNRLTACTIENGVAHIIMKAPEQLNALDLPMVSELKHHLDACAVNEKVKVVVLSGEGKSFCAGGNVAFFHEALQENDFDALEEIVKQVGALIVQMKTHQKLIIAAVQGHAVGGGANLALAADFIIGDESIKLAQVFTKIGLSPDSGGMYLFSKALGASRAMELCISAKTLNGTDLLELGLIIEVTAAGTAVQRALEFGAEIAAGPVVAYEGAKRENYEVNFSDFKQYIEDVEFPLVAKTLRSQDFKEAVTAFVEKRQPNYRGK